MQLNPEGVAETIYSPIVPTVTYAAITSSISAGITFSMISKTPSYLFCLINNIQTLTYFPLSTVPLPEELKAQMVSINLQNYFPNPIDLSNDVKKGLELTAPQFALDYGISDATFLANAGIILATYAISLSLVPVLWLLSKVKWPRIAKFFREFLAGYKWRNVVIHWIESYLDLSIACFLQLRVVIFKAGLFCLSRSGL